ncbi:MAG: dephospho-CoA kinase [Elusimicrobia bacterium]|nr:dephospho-CoA kinase [Elusimicrobiota bacterium]
MKKSKPVLTLALTGGFGSGKSSALKAFAQMGAATFDCDAIARDLTAGRGPLVARIGRLFGGGVLDASGRLDRAKTASLIFNNPSRRRRLEALLHPAILTELSKRLANSKAALRVVEVPLLFENEKKLLKRRPLYDASLTVWASPETIRRRLSAKGWTKDDIERRRSSQMPLDEKCCKADFILDNNGARQKLTGQVRAIQNACQAILRDYREARKQRGKGEAANDKRTGNQRARRRNRTPYE